jgi:hypothetical protein
MRHSSLLASTVAVFACWGCVPAGTANDDDQGSLSAELSGQVAIGSTLATTAALNLRTGAGTGYSVIKVMPLGSHVITINRTTAVSGFFNVSSAGVTGWASGTYLKLISGPAAPDAGSAPPPVVDAGTGGGPVGSGAWTPTSKGLWIWYFAYTGYTAAQAAAMAQADGVGYVLIKSGQDASFWNTRYTAANVAEFTSRGIKVFAWPYITPSNISGSIDAVAQAAQVPGTSGVVLDVEIEFEGNYASQAKSLCQGIRARVPNVWLGYTSFGWVGYHATLPFSTFDEYCGDGFFPQVYWSDRGVTWSYGYNQALQQIAAAGLHAPVWMIQSNDNTPSGTAPSTADLNAFYAQSGTLSSLWEFPAAGLSSKVTQLSDLNWSN